MDDYGINQMVYGVIHLSSARKQAVGRALASHLSFVPGPGGRDGSVDGAIISADNLLLAHFQSKLSSSPISLNEEKVLHSDLIRLAPSTCVYISGVGYEESFVRLLESQGMFRSVDIHLLTLADVFSQSVSYVRALQSIPEHAGGIINWSRFHV